MSARFSEAVRAKARSIPAEDIEQVDDEGRLWRVRSGRTGRMHTVQFITGGDPEGEVPIVDWITCSCQHGQTNGGQAGCYHAAAADMARRDEAEEE